MARYGNYGNLAMKTKYDKIKKNMSTIAFQQWKLKKRKNCKNMDLKIYCLCILLSTIPHYLVLFSQKKA